MPFVNICSNCGIENRKGATECKECDCGVEERWIEDTPRTSRIVGMMSSMSTTSASTFKPTNGRIPKTMGRKPSMAENWRSQKGTLKSSDKPKLDVAYSGRSVKKTSSLVELKCWYCKKYFPKALPHITKKCKYVTCHNADPCSICEAPSAYTHITSECKNRNPCDYCREHLPGVRHHEATDCKHADMHNGAKPCSVCTGLAKYTHTTATCKSKNPCEYCAKFFPDAHSHISKDCRHLSMHMKEPCSNCTGTNSRTHTTSDCRRKFRALNCTFCKVHSPKSRAHETTECYYLDRHKKHTQCALCFSMTHDANQCKLRCSDCSKDDSTTFHKGIECPKKKKEQTL